MYRRSTPIQFEDVKMEEISVVVMV